MRFVQKSANVPTKLTCQAAETAWNEVCANSKYDSKNEAHNKIYRSIKDELCQLYEHKCAYCEQITESLHVEHYRPKKKYHQLAFSWDNLVLACETCNTKKSTNFPIQKNKYLPQSWDWQTIHKQTPVFNLEEKPDFIHPEQEDVTNLIRFDADGNMSSDDRRVNETIEKLELNRDSLKKERKKVIVQFEQRLNNISKKEDLKREIIRELNFFKQEANDLSNSFTLFREYMLENGWLKPIIKSFL